MNNLNQFALPAWKLLAVLLLLSAGHQALAQQAGMIQGLQMPAWIERRGARAPLSPGMLLNSGDRLMTGSGARILLQLGDGSFVKLGENADFVLRDIVPASSPKGVFSGLLDVVKGAFRYTTTLLSRQRRHNLSIRIAAVTARVRGTDLWAKAAADKDILCLIDGDILVQPDGGAAFRMNQPLSFYTAVNGDAAKPVAPVAPEQLQRWAAQVELSINDGALTGSGPWSLIITSLLDRALALQRQQELQAAGYPVVIEAVTLKGRHWHRLVIRGLARAIGANKVAKGLEGKFGIRDAWIRHN